MLKILGYAGSINVRKVLWACAELGLAFEREDWAGGFRSTSEPEFLARNPFGMVPVIHDGAITLSESNAIIRYLAARERRFDLLPEDPAKRARIEMWMDWQASDFNNSWRPAFMGLVRKRAEHQDPSAIAHSMAEFNRMIGLIERALSKSGGYIAGAEFTLADIPIGLSLHRWRGMPCERPSFANAEHYYQRLCERSGFQAYGRGGGP